jgi:membrane glycosyltransferase
MGRKAIAVLILIAETALATYLALVLWLLSGWMVEDSQASRMASSDWYMEAARRFGAALLVGLVFGASAYFANQRWLTPRLPGWPLLGTRAAVFLASCIVLCGALGAVQFIVTKPFM